MSNLTEYAKNELLLMDSGYDGTINSAVLELIELFSKRHHSGGSAGTIINLFGRLARFNPITNIADAPEQWTKIDCCGDTETEPVRYQHRRCPVVFKQAGVVTYLDGYRFSDDGGTYWWITNESRIELQLPCRVPDTKDVHVEDVNNISDEEMKIAGFIPLVTSIFGIG